jgi:hypothetical protein
MLSSLLAALAVMTVRSRFDDPDMWWHLRMGQIVWTTHTIPATDIFSFTTGHHAWVPHEWLAQILIYGAYRFGGYSGLMLWLCVTSALLLIAGYVLCSLYSGNAKVAIVGAMAIWFFATAGFAIRPQMIGYLFLVIELVVIHLGRSRGARWFFCLPFLFVLWVNCHGSFFLGIVVADVFLACSFFDFRSGLLLSVRWSPRAQRALAISLALSVGALFINPIGWRTVAYPLNTMLHQPIGLANAEEWMPLQMNSARGAGLLVVLACILLLIMIRRSELFLDELILLAMGTWLAVGHRRMVFVFGILAAPVLSRLLSNMWDGYDRERDHPVPNAILIALAAAFMIMAFPNARNLTSQVEAGSPVKAVEFMKAHRLAGNMLNDYTYGGYLIWAAPEHPVFIDGRADVYEWTGVMQDFGRWAMVQTDPNILLDKYRIQFCLLSADSPMTHVLPVLPNWKRIYADANSVIFVRAVPTTASR